MRQHYVEYIQNIISEDECIDICFDAEWFHQNCDRAYVTFKDRRHDCDISEEATSFYHDGASTENGFVCYEDMTITEVMQCYRCIIEFKEWKETGKITYM